MKVAGADSDSPLIMLELRQLGGALSRPPADLSPMGRSDSRFILNGIGATPTPEMAQAVQAYLAYIAEAVEPYASGATYVNFLDLDGATPERVKAAYSPRGLGAPGGTQGSPRPGQHLPFQPQHTAIFGRGRGITQPA